MGSSQSTGGLSRSSPEPAAARGRPSLSRASIASKTELGGPARPSQVGPRGHLAGDGSQRRSLPFGELPKRRHLIGESLSERVQIAHDLGVRVEREEEPSRVAQRRDDEARRILEREVAITLEHPGSIEMKRALGTGTLEDGQLPTAEPLERPGSEHEQPRRVPLEARR